MRRRLLPKPLQQPRFRDPQRQQFAQPLPRKLPALLTQQPQPKFLTQKPLQRPERTVARVQRVGLRHAAHDAVLAKRVRLRRLLLLLPPLLPLPAPLVRQLKAISCWAGEGQRRVEGVKQLLRFVVRVVLMVVPLLLVVAAAEVRGLDLPEQFGAVGLAPLHGGAQNGPLRLALVLVLAGLLLVGQRLPGVALDPLLLPAVAAVAARLRTLVRLHHAGEPPALRLALVPVTLVVLLRLATAKAPGLLRRHRVAAPLVFLLSALVLLLALGCALARQVQQWVLAEHRVGKLHGAVTTGETPRLHVSEPLPRIADQRLVPVLLPFRPPILALLDAVLGVARGGHVVSLLAPLRAVVSRLPVVWSARPRLSLPPLLLPLPRHVVGQPPLREEVVVGALFAVTPLLPEACLRQQHPVGLPLLLVAPPGHALSGETIEDGVGPLLECAVVVGAVVAAVVDPLRLGLPPAPVHAVVRVVQHHPARLPPKPLRHGRHHQPVHQPPHPDRPVPLLLRQQPPQPRLLHGLLLLPPLLRQLFALPKGRPAHKPPHQRPLDQLKGVRLVALLLRPLRRGVPLHKLLRAAPPLRRQLPLQPSVRPLEAQGQLKTHIRTLNTSEQRSAEREHPWLPLATKQPQRPLAVEQTPPIEQLQKDALPLLLE